MASHEAPEANWKPGRKPKVRGTGKKSVNTVPVARQGNGSGERPGGTFKKSKNTVPVEKEEKMRRKNLWLRVSSCTMAALLATTSVAPVSAADFTSEIVMEDTQEEATAEVETEEPVIEEETQDEAAEVAEDTAEADFAEADEAGFTDTYEAADFADSADAVSDGADETAQAGFGTANTVLAKGTYTVPASLKNASDTSKDSMAASCIAGDATMEVAEDGSAKVTVPIQKVTVYGQTSGATDWKIYKGDTKSDTTDAEFTTDENGDVTSITFTVPDKTADGAYVKMTVALMGTSVDAYLKLDYANAQKVAPAVDTTALEETIAKADTLEENAYTKATWDANKEAIDTANTAAKAALEAKESQEAVDAANTALTEAMAKLVEAGDPTELKAKIEEAKALKETDYTVKSVQNWWKSIQTDITNGEEAIEGRESTQKLNRCLSDLNSDMGRLVEAYDTTKLEQKIAEAQALKEEDYTAESWKEAGIAKKISNAQGMIDVRGSKEDINGALNELEDAMDTLVAVSVEVTVGRGDFAKKLKPGTYSLPIELLNAGHIASTNEYTSKDYMKHTSMAAGCFKDGIATLVIHEDGTATLTTAVGAVSSDKLGATRSDAADDWTIYENTQDFLEGKANSSKGARFKAHIDKQAMVNNKRKPSQISFTVPDLKQNVIGTRMHIEVMGVYQDACIGLDWTNVEKVSDDTSATSTVEKVYEVKADTLTQLKNMKAGTTVKLDEDVTLTEDLTVKGGTLDLNGHVLTQGENLIRIKGDVTIIDSSADKTGKIVGGLYMPDTYSQATITVEKGSLTADGVTIDGQIGNELYYDGIKYLAGLPHVTVTLTNCTLTNSLNKSDFVYFEDMASGVDLTVDKCISDKAIEMSNCTGDNVKVTESSLAGFRQSSSDNGTLVFTGNTVSGSVSIRANEMTVKDDTIEDGLSFGGRKGKVTLENITSTSSSAALSVAGSVEVTIKSGVYTSTGRRAYAIDSDGYPVMIEGGYFQAKKGVVNSDAYKTPAGKALGEVTEGEYAGYQTVIDAEDVDITDPAMTIYNPDGSVADKIADEKVGMATTFAAEGQTVKLNKDVEAESEIYYKNITLDLNGHTLTLAGGMVAYFGTCHVIDSSADKTGKLVANTWAFTSMDSYDSGLTLDGVTCETPCLQYASIGKFYVINGAKVIGTNTVSQSMGAGSTYIQDSTWTFAEGTDGQALLENVVRTAQYSITKNEDGSFTIAVSDLGKAMRAFEALDASQYTKASYAAAKEIYDEVDGTVDDELTAEDIAQKAQELNAAIAALVTPASESDIKALNDAVAAAKKLSSSSYTSASYKALTTAIAAAEKVLAAEEPSAADVATATKALADAKAKLVKMVSQSITGVSSTYSKKYGDKAFTLKAKAKTTVSYKSSNTKVATVDKNGKVMIKGVGTAKITITAAAKNNYKAATKTVTIKVAKAAPTIKVKTTSANVRYANLRSRAQVFSLGASVNSKGKLTYKKVSGSSAISVASNGRVTVKKGMKKGTYKAVIRVYAGAKGNYNSGYKTVTVTVRVR